MLQQIKSRQLFMNSAILFILFEIVNLLDWFPVKFWGLASSEHFDDCKQVLTWTDNNDSLLDNLRNKNNNYGSLLTIILKFLHFRIEWYVYLGHITILLVCISFAILLNISNLGLFNIFILFTIFSPPILLLLERANLDGFIFFFCVCGYSYLLNNKFFRAFALFSLASLLKLYVAPILLFFCVYSKISAKNKIYFRIFTCLLFVILLIDYLFRNLSFHYVGNSQFGLLIWKYTMRKVIGNSAPNLGTFFSIFIFFLILILVFRNRKLISTEILVGEQISIENIFYFILLSSFILTLNYDYRLVFLVAFIVIIYSNIKVGYVSSFKWFVSSILWLTYPARGLEPLGDFFLEFFLVIVLKLIIDRKYYYKKNPRVNQPV